MVVVSRSGNRNPKTVHKLTMFPVQCLEHVNISPYMAKSIKVEDGVRISALGVLNILNVLNIQHSMC